MGDLEKRAAEREKRAARIWVWFLATSIVFFVGILIAALIAAQR